MGVLSRRKALQKRERGTRGNALPAGGKEVSDWQPIATAPKDGTHVLLWLSGEGYHGPRRCNVTVGVYTDSGWYYIADGRGGKTSNEPSRWMPLPDPPA
jgi:hypothetical protein